MFSKTDLSTAHILNVQMYIYFHLYLLFLSNP